LVQYRPWLNPFETVSNEFKSNSNLFKFASIQKGSSVARKFKIKYGFEGFDERNNFAYRNFLGFKMDFELKFKEASWV
jgi:hypothetical protein